MYRIYGILIKTMNLSFIVKNKNINIGKDEKRQGKIKNSHIHTLRNIIGSKIRVIAFSIKNLLLILKK